MGREKSNKFNGIRAGGEVKMCMPRMITIEQASVATGLSYDSIRKMCMANQIVHIRVGRKYMINSEKLEQYLNGETEQEEEVND